MQAHKSKKIGLALGGGGARGIAHIGVLKALSKAQIPIDLIVGTSIGSIVGAVYALDPDVRELEEKLYQFLKNSSLDKMETLFIKPDDPYISRQHMLKKVSNFMRELFIWRTRSTKQWLIDTQQIEKLLYPLVENKTFQDCKIPFYAIATDLISGDRIILEEGLLLDALQASSSIPGIMQPFSYQGRLLTDGSLLDPVPVEQARAKGATTVIAVNVGHGVKRKKRFHNIADIAEQADYIKSLELSKYKLASADVVIEPRVMGISWAHFSKAREIIQRGEIACWKKLQQIKLANKTPKKLGIFKKLFWGKRKTDVV
ncbi:MAG: patatin-like phospholipase family protein [Chlamydiota bacterium]|nr:patatin-like phospholipase family protein [Chlamydiota bacterium]